METLTRMLDTVYLANSLRAWLLAGLVFCATFLVVPFVRGRIAARLRKRHTDAGGGESAVPEFLGALLARTSRLVLLSVALYFAEKLLVLPKAVDRLFDVIIVFGIAVQMALWAGAALRFFIDRHYSNRTGRDAGSRASVSVLLFVGQLLIWSVFALLALDNLGVNVTALVAGLGVGGIAIALAVQTILGDLLGSLSIALDKPFVVGDHLRIDDVEGTVEYIGIKSTRLRALTGEQVILSNADLLKSRVRNLGRMAERRALFRIGVTYETSPEKLRQVAGLVKGAIEAVPHTRFLQCPLISLGADSLEFEPIFYVASRPDVGYGTTIGEVNQQIFSAFAKAGIAFAYPTRRLLVEQAAIAAPAVSS